MAASTDQYRQHQLPATSHRAPQQYPYQQEQPYYQQQQTHPQLQQRQQQRQQQQKPPAEQPNQPPHHTHNKSRTFSFHSQKSHKSSGSKDLHESSAEKEAKRLHSKADPTLAISEAEPSMEAAMRTVSTIAPLRSIQHKDSLGNPIADPDKSNPTRNRWERPLDTIRSFEAAIDGNYSRKSLYRTDTDSQSQYNRRSSVYGGNLPRFPQDSYYGGRPTSFRPESTQFELSNGGGSRSGHLDVYGGGYNPGPSRQRVPRSQTDPQYQGYGRNQNIYPLPHKDRSYETVTSAAASGNSDQAGYQTDPTSSDNSSIERTSPAKRQEPINDYGIGFSQPQAYQSQGFSVGLNGGVRQPGQPSSQQIPPAVPGKEKTTLLRRQSTQQSTSTQRPAAEKRKSWFSRRFSKNA